MPKHEDDPGSRSRAANLTWLVLTYRVPSEPTRLRASVWRKLKGMGAVYLQSSTAVVPHSPERERALRTLRNDIVGSLGGTASLLSARALAGESDIVAALNAARDDEYEEILDKCRDFHDGLDKEFAADHFTYGELEENEEDLKKLQRWTAKVRLRDSLGAQKAAEVDKALGACSEHLQEFANRVFQSDSEGF